MEGAAVSPVAGFFLLVFALLISVMLLRVACRLVTGFSPSYRMAIGASALYCLISMVVGEVLRMGTGDTQPELDLTSILIMLAIGFLIQSAVYAWMIRDPMRNRISLGKACGVSAVQLGLGLGLALVGGLATALFLHFR